MCGITGAIWTDPRRAIDRETLGRMVEVLRHRGPDAGGTHESGLRLRPPYDPLPGVALGHRRLAIIDVPGGKQPMSNEDETVWVVFNGEIYNHARLRHRLEGNGHRFRTHCDTEVIVHLYEDCGTECFAHLQGMFAIAVWDQNQRRLIVGRDRLGQKPLVYSHDSGRLLFASELKSLLEVPDLRRELDPEAIDLYLTYQYVPHPKTIFRGIHKLPPGHHLEFQDDRISVRPYWNLDFSREDDRSSQEWSRQIREAITASVHTRMQADVSLGAFLSGGVDSSLIVALMQQASDVPVRTFTIGFPESEYDETHHARRVAQHLGTDHREFIVTPSAVEVLPELVWHYDEPFADSSAIPTWYLSKQTREHVTVALTGDGGDELFLGYDRYRAVDLAGWFDRLPRPASRLLGLVPWQQISAGGTTKSRWRHLLRFLEALPHPAARRYLDWIAIFGEQRRADLYRDEFLTALPDNDPFAWLATPYGNSRERDFVTATSLVDLTTYLPCDLMTKVDIASMAHGLECRQPLLDHHVVELASAMPRREKIRGGRGKWILREAFGDLLPRDIWQRRKMGFGVPLDHWFRGELKAMTQDMLLSDDARCAELFRPEVMRRQFQQHQEREADHSSRLWALLVLEHWLRRWDVRLSV